MRHRGRGPGLQAGLKHETMREIYKEAGGSSTYEAVGVLGAGAAAGALPMAAVAHVRPKTSTVTLLCTHGLCHWERKKSKKKRSFKDWHTKTANTASIITEGHLNNIWGGGAFQRWVEVSGGPEEQSLLSENPPVIFFSSKKTEPKSEAFLWPPSGSKAVPEDRNPPVLHIHVPAIGALIQGHGSSHSLLSVSCFGQTPDPMSNIYYIYSVIFFTYYILTWIPRLKSKSRSGCFPNLLGWEKPDLIHICSQLSELWGAFSVFSVTVNDNIWLNLLLSTVKRCIKVALTLVLKNSLPHRVQPQIHQTASQQEHEMEAVKLLCSHSSVLEHYDTAERNMKKMVQNINLSGKNEKKT